MEIAPATGCSRSATSSLASTWGSSASWSTDWHGPAGTVARSKTASHSLVVRCAIVVATSARNCRLITAASGLSLATSRRQGGDRHHAVARPIGAVVGVDQARGPVNLGSHPGRAEVAAQEAGPLHEQRRGEQRGLNLLTGAVALAREEGRTDGPRDGDAGGQVDHRGVEGDRDAVLDAAAGHHQPGHGLDDQVVAGSVR